MPVLTPIGRARLRPSRQWPLRLSRSFALPRKPVLTPIGRARLRPSRQWPWRLSMSIALPGSCRRSKRLDIADEHLVESRACRRGGGLVELDADDFGMLSSLE